MAPEASNKFNLKSHWLVTGDWWQVISDVWLQVTGDLWKNFWGAIRTLPTMLVPGKDSNQITWTKKPCRRRNVKDRCDKLAASQSQLIFKPQASLRQLSNITTCNFIVNMSWTITPNLYSSGNNGVTIVSPACSSKSASCSPNTPAPHATRIRSAKEASGLQGVILKQHWNNPTTHYPEILQWKTETYVNVNVIYIYMYIYIYIHVYIF